MKLLLPLLLSFAAVMNAFRDAQAWTQGAHTSCTQFYSFV